MINKPVTNKRTIIIKSILVAVNIFLVMTAIIFSWRYSVSFRESSLRSKLDSFCTNVESMKQVSDNYLRMELGYAMDWSKYISDNNMTMDEAIEYIRSSNNQSDRYAHIVDMDTYKAYSTYSDTGSYPVTCYLKYSEDTGEFGKLFISTMKKMFSPDDCFNILGKYRADDTKLNVISVGTKVTIRNQNGSDGDYLLLRVIPIESIRKIWVFPVEYKSAEVGIITRTGDYVVPSKSMKSQSFGEFIRGYNYTDNYNGINELYDRLLDSDNGIMQYLNSKGVNCYWYYSSFGDETGLDILGCIPVSALNSHQSNYIIVIVICCVFFALIILDGSYILHINRRLRYTASLAEEASKAKTRFLSTMSHDIRTPMNGIIGMTNIAKKHIDDAGYVNDCLDKITLASDHLLTLINDILDISKVESGTIVLNESSFSINQSIDKLINIVQVQIADKQIDFNCTRSLDVPYIIADELRLNQIFINLLTNAVKYTPKHGHITLCISDEFTSDDNVRLTYSVSDDGIGMSEDFQQNMYVMFTRESDSRIDKTQGTGLGLAIVKQIVDLMGGSITCTSSPGNGTIFTVTLDFKAAAPAKMPEDSAMSGDALPVTDLSGMHILIAEDNDLNWEILDELLGDYNIRCDRAVNGRECVDILENSEDFEYDIVLMDVQMPVMDGKQASRLIRQSTRPYVKNITIIATTADAFAEDIRDCVNAGMNGHISKPVDINKLVDVLRTTQQHKGDN